MRAQLSRWRLPEGLEASDIVQECYARLAAMDCVAGILNPRAYLFSVARNIMLMHLRRSRVVSIRAVGDLETYALATDEPTPEQQVSDGEQLELLASAVAALPEPGRQAFILRVIDDLPHREIGQRLGLSDDAVQKSVAKSLRILADLLGRGGNAAAGASKTPVNQQAAQPDEPTRDERGH